MLLRVGLAMLALSILLATGVIVVVNRSAEAPAVQDEQAELVAAGTAEQKKNKYDFGEKLELDEEPRQEQQEESKTRSGTKNPRSGPSTPRVERRAATAEKKKKPATRRRGREPLPVSNNADWPVPTREELSLVQQPRYFDTNPNAVMTLTIEALGLYDVPIIDSYGEEALDQGVIHIPDTAYPWDGSDEKNVFLAGHRTGVPGEDSRLLFFELDELREGDEIELEDLSGNTYRYRVEELFRVGPYDAWVADTLVDRDLLTLQTCTYPDFEDRLVVRADRA